MEKRLHLKSCYKNAPIFITWCFPVQCRKTKKGAWPSRPCGLLASFSKSVLSWTAEQKPHTGGTPVPLSFSCKQDSIGRGTCASLVSDLVHPVTMLNSTLINSEM